MLGRLDGVKVPWPSLRRWRSDEASLRRASGADGLARLLWSLSELDELDELDGLDELEMGNTIDTVRGRSERLMYMKKNKQSGRPGAGAEAAIDAVG